MGHHDGDPTVGYVTLIIRLHTSMPMLVDKYTLTCGHNSLKLSVQHSGPTNTGVKNNNQLTLLQ